jgi:hypothetical protein
MKSFNSLDKEALLEEIVAIYEQLESVISDFDSEYVECLQSDDFSECISDVADPDFNEILLFTKEMKNFIDSRG